MNLDQRPKCNPNGHVCHPTTFFLKFLDAANIVNVSLLITIFLQKNVNQYSTV